jgi:hypothetical protein
MMHNLCWYPQLMAWLFSWQHVASQASRVSACWGLTGLTWVACLTLVELQDRVLVHCRRCRDARLCAMFVVGSVRGSVTGQALTKANHIGVLPSLLLPPCSQVLHRCWAGNGGDEGAAGPGCAPLQLCL